MNNEPVAWFEQDPDMKSVWYQADKDAPNAIPLYTHPAKESKAKDRFSNYESICLQCGTTIYKPAKTLTDEEKKQITKEYLHRHLLYVVTEEVVDDHKLHNVVVSDFDFAKAILRKTQEK